MEKIGLLIMAYGTPYKKEDIKRYYTHIRNGREPSQKALDELTERYEAIGGISPMAEITQKQVEAIANNVNEMQDEVEFVPYLGLKHIEPFIEDAVESIYNDGIKKIVSLVLAPHYSSLSIKSYNNRARKQAQAYHLHMQPIESWYKEEGFIQYWANAIQNQLAPIPSKEKEGVLTIFSAHSLPKNILKVQDPYVDQLKETARLIAQKAGLNNYEIAWQSEGNTNVEWLGPDVSTITEEKFHQNHYHSFLYAPVGFVSDHLEILYDNDIECKETCHRLGVNYLRPEMPNTNELFIRTLANLVWDETKKLINYV